MKQQQLRIAVLGTGIVASIWIINIVSAHDGHKTRNAPASAKKIKNPYKANEQTIVAGQTLYNQHCASCHGEDGKSGTEMAGMMEKKPTNLTAKAMRGITDGEIFWVITYGIKKSGMPAFNPGVSWRDRWQMTLYVKHLMGEHPQLASSLRKTGQKTSEQGGNAGDHHAHHAAETKGNEGQKQKTAEQADQHTHHTGVNERGDKVMGFTHEKTIHRFRLMTDGGLIEIVARDPNDVTSRDQIRAHLREIEQKFTAGDFTAPALIHAQTPPGLTVIKELKALINYQFGENGTGGFLYGIEPRSTQARGDCHRRGSCGSGRSTLC
ncbi:MAG: cytochrome c, partial [Acidobacteria bacterium]|nr:cytochrome c [Acidobacteriota bacterium]